MITNPDGNLHVFLLNVGQGDTTVIVSPEGRVILIDAKNPQKIKRLLKDIGCEKVIEHLIITHPHTDHFCGANSLLDSYTINETTFAPFWHEFGMGPPTYRKLVDRLDGNDVTKINFISGYSRWYPDQILKQGAAGEDSEIDPDAPYLELLGPTNGLISQLEDAKVFNANHLSIMSRLNWKDFCMVISGDAQMENWGPFDNEKLLEKKCCLLRAAHHGSSNGTQWERIDRLSPTIIVVSSDPLHGHNLPDLGSAAVFAKFDRVADQFAVITSNSGTIRCIVQPNGDRKFYRYGEQLDDNVDLQNPIDLNEIDNPTDWSALVLDRINEV